MLDNMIPWEKRKMDHLKLTLDSQEKPDSAGFQDAKILNCSLPDLDLADIDITTNFLGKKLQAPILINALTGGAESLTPINKALARAAARTGVAMAVGSQTIALRNPKFIKSFRIVRETNPEGIILANVGADVSWQEALQAVEMISADALQVHLNVPQELIMAEGDRNFKGYVENIRRINEHLKVPLIIKEVGFGLSREIVRQLMADGILHFDIGGRGGTNFIAIENKRNQSANLEYYEEWGIPTFCSLLEVASTGVPGHIIATGGVRSPLEAVKALAIGADMVGMAGTFVRIIREGSENNLVEFIDSYKENISKILLMSGAANLKGLRKKPVVITGFSREWLIARGIEINEYARR